MSATRAAAAGVAGGVLLALTLPPWGWWPLGAVGSAVVLVAWRDQPLRCRLAVALPAGLAFHVVGLWWMTEFSLPGYVATVVVETAILAAFLLLVPARGWPRLVAFPAALVVAQAVQGHWPFGGVPLNTIALGQVGGPLAPAARLSGHLLLVALVGTAGVGLALLWESRRQNRRGLVTGAVALAAVGGIALMGAVAPMGTEGKLLHAAAVQGGGVRGLRAIDAVPTEVFAAQLRTSGAVHPPVDLMVWPEDVIDADAGPERPDGAGGIAGSPEDAAMAALARELRATVVAGVIEDAPGRRFRNAAVAWGPDGSQVDRYEKVRRVPFGEYIPARSLVDAIADVSAVPRDAIAGRGPGVLRTPAGTLGVLISYEVFFADRGRAAVRAGGTLLLVPTNASSFTTSQVPGQELAAARLRAIETGRSVVQAAPTGYSAVVDPTGRVRARSGLGSPAVVQRPVRLRHGQTVATRLGDGPITLAAIVGLGGVVAFRWLTRKKT